MQSIEEKIDVKEILSQNLSQINSVLEKWVPRSISSKDQLSSVLGSQLQCDLEALNKCLFEPIWNLLDRGGKRWRSTLLLLIAECLGKSVEYILDFVVISEIIHNGTLIVDDIEDDSEFRRGQPCLHKITGVDIAVNVGNFMYFLPLRVLREYKKISSPLKFCSNVTRSMAKR